MPDYKALIEHLKAMDKPSLLVFLGNRDARRSPNVYELSYGLYYLGLRNMQENVYGEGLQHLHNAADQYCNPLAMVKLAMFYSMSKEQMVSTFGEQAISFAQDWSKTYFYINAALHVSGIILKSSNDKTILNLVVANGLGILDSFNMASVKAAFDFAGAEKSLPAQLLRVEEQYRRLFGGLS